MAARPVVALGSGAPSVPTTVQGLRIEAAVDGDGIVAAELSHVVVRDVQLAGPWAAVDPAEDAPSVRAGVRLECVMDAQIDRLDANGFLEAGGSLVRSTVRWTGRTNRMTSSS